MCHSPGIAPLGKVMALPPPNASESQMGSSEGVEGLRTHLESQVSQPPHPAG